MKTWAKGRGDTWSERATELENLNIGLELFFLLFKYMIGIGAFLLSRTSKVTLIPAVTSIRQRFSGDENDSWSSCFTIFVTFTVTWTRLCCQLQKGTHYCLNWKHFKLNFLFEGSLMWFSPGIPPARSEPDRPPSPRPGHCHQQWWWCWWSDTEKKRKCWWRDEKVKKESFVIICFKFQPHSGEPSHSIQPMWGHTLKI